MSFTQQLAQQIAKTSFAGCSATVVGCGYMGVEYVKALQTLRAGSIRVCSRTPKPLEVEFHAGGYQNFSANPRPDELAIIAVPTQDLVPAVRHFYQLGFRRFLIEKPISLYSEIIRDLQNNFAKEDCMAVCAYNRVAYPSFLEAGYFAKEEGGISSCHYTMTEIVNPVWEERFPKEELARWGIANSLHVASMAHGLIGLPSEIKAIRKGSAFPWHPAGNVFVGTGISKQGIPFTYHADWTSTGRWSVEFHTRKASYLLCPLEKLFRRTSFKESWAEVSLSVFDEKVKMGVLEETAAMLRPELRSWIPLCSLEETRVLTEFGEEIFGYAA